MKLSMGFPGAVLKKKWLRGFFGVFLLTLGMDFCLFGVSGLRAFGRNAFAFRWRAFAMARDGGGWATGCGCSVVVWGSGVARAARGVMSCAR